MRIDRIELQNFMGLTADIALTERVNIFFGRNGQGKTAVLDAVPAAAHGKLPDRGLTTMKALKACVGTDGVANWSLDVFTDNGQIHRDPKQNFGELPVELRDELLCQVIFRPMTVLTMKPAERQKLFMGLFKGESPTVAIDAYLARQSLSDEAKRRIRADLDGAQQWAIGLRKQAKHELSALVEPESPAQVVEIGGHDIDLAGPSQNFQATLQVRQTRLNEVRGYLDVEPEDLEELQQTAEKAAAELESLDMKKASEAVHEARGQVGKAEKTSVDLEKTYYSAEAVANLCERQIEQVAKVQAGARCPWCDREIADPTFAIQTLQARLKTEFSPTADKASELWRSAANKATGLREELATAKEIEGAVREAILAANEKMAGLRTRITAARDDAVTRPDLLLEAAQLTQKIGFLTEAIEAKNAYDAMQSAVESYNSAVAACRAKIEEMNDIDHLLKPDGELRQIATSVLNTITFDEFLCDAWDMTSLSVEPDGSITVFNRPVEMASASETWRASVLIADLLARTAKTGFLVLDGVDVLTDSREALKQRLVGWGEEYDSVLVNCAAAERPCTPPAGIGFWWVGDGTVVSVD